MTETPRKYGNQWTADPYRRSSFQAAVADAVYQLWFADVEMLQKLFADKKRDTVANVCYELSRRKILGKARIYERFVRSTGSFGRRWVYTIGERYKAEVPPGYRAHLKMKLDKSAHDAEHDYLRHDLMLSRFHAFLMLGENRKLWTLKWRQGKGAFTKYKLDHIPDAYFCLTTHKPFHFFLEVERRGTRGKYKRHVEDYISSFSDKHKDSPIPVDSYMLTLRETREKAEDWFEAAREVGAQDLGRKFIFLSEQQFDDGDWNPEELLKNVVQSASGRRVALVPPPESATIQ